MTYLHPAMLPRLIPPGLLSLFLILPGRPAAAGAPYVVDDGYLSPDRGCQVEAWWVSAPSQNQLNVFPACQVVPNLDIALGATFNLPVGGPNSTDITLQFKRVLWSSGNLDLAMSAGTVFRPDTQPGDRFVRNGFVYAAFSQALADKLLVLNYNLGWTYDQTPATSRNLATWGIRARVTPQERFDLAAEYFGDNQEPPFVQAGLRVWIVPEHVRVMTSFGQQLGREGFWTVGLCLYSPPFL